MIFAVLPVKAPHQAKQRLGAVLDPREREALARLLYETVLRALCAASGLDRIAVATSDAATAENARRSGALVFEEQLQRSHSASAAWAVRRATALGATTILLIPIDVPLVTPAEIEDLAAASARADVCIVPSSDGAGTNALALRPPRVIEPRFGEQSFRLHHEQAQACGAAVLVLRPPGLVFDLDTPADAAALLARAPESPIAALLRPKCLSRS
ncbi:MAG TPA: 2-phospho-L-lactate guanylyltransferase [Bryobacterales bacterium]|nr:2-phospho-L-lactate guanylyltransferase [Bryobacterales bacterium]